MGWGKFITENGPKIAHNYNSIHLPKVLGSTLYPLTAAWFGKRVCKMIAETLRTVAFHDRARKKTYYRTRVS